MKGPFLPKSSRYILQKRPGFVRGEDTNLPDHTFVHLSNHRHPKVLQAVYYEDGKWWVECLGKRQELEVPDGSRSPSMA